MNFQFQRSGVIKTPMLRLKNYLLLATLLFYCQATSAQLFVNDIDFAVTKFNEMTTFMEELSAKQISQQDLDELKNRRDVIVDRLARYCSGMNKFEQRPALYFSTLAKYEYGHFLGLTGKNEQCYQQFKEIQPDFAFMDKWDYPISHYHARKTHLIQRKHLDARRAAYYGTYGMLCYQLGYYAEAKGLLARAIFHPESDNWQNYTATYYMQLVKQKLNEYDQQLAEAAANFANAYNYLPRDKKEMAISNNYARPDFAFTVLKEVYTKKPKTKKLDEYFGAVAEPLIKAGFKAQGIESLKIAFKKGNKNFFVCMYAIDMAEKENDKELAALAADKLRALVGPGDCTRMFNVAKGYRIAGDIKKAEAFEKKAKECK